MLQKYNKTFNTKKTLLPSVFSMIKALPDSYVYSKQYDNMRHPGGILTRATEEIVNSMNNVLSFLRQVENSLQDNNNVIPQELLTELQYLVGHYDSFQDECYLVLKGFCPPPSIDHCPDEKFVHNWLKGNGFISGETFVGRTKNIQKYIDMFSNGLKHGNRRFDFVFVKVDGCVISGVFIDELKGETIKEVYPWIGDRMKKATVAFSLSYLMKALMVSYYTICDALEIAIKDQIKSVHGVKWSKKEIQKESDPYGNMIKKVADMPHIFFPYEHKKSPKVMIRGSEVKISYPHGDKIPYRGSLQASSIHTADGYTRDFALPFFG